MKNGLILYKSKYGSSKKYAQWLSEATGWPLTEADHADNATLTACDTLVLCGGVYASGMAGLSVIKKHAALLKDKQVLLLAVGASPYDEKAIAEAKAHNLKGDLAGLPLFYARGAWDMGKMTLAHRMLCGMLKKAVAKQDPATFEPWQEALMSILDGESCDWTDRSYLEPLLSALLE